VLRNIVGADDPRGPGGLRNLPEKKESQCIVCSTKRGGREPDATRGCMENASLNTGANCKRYICTVLHNVMQFQTRVLFMHKPYIKIYRKIVAFIRA
jgi:hypothetical protein